MKNIIEVHLSVLILYNGIKSICYRAIYEINYRLLSVKDICQ